MTQLRIRRNRIQLPIADELANHDPRFGEFSSTKGVVLGIDYLSIRAATISLSSAYTPSASRKLTSSAARASDPRIAINPTTKKGTERQDAKTKIRRGGTDVKQANALCVFLGALASWRSIIPAQRDALPPEKLPVHKKIVAIPS